MEVLLKDLTQHLQTVQDELKNSGSKFFCGEAPGLIQEIYFIDKITRKIVFAGFKKLFYLIHILLTYHFYSIIHINLFIIIYP